MNKEAYDEVVEQSKREKEGLRFGVGIADVNLKVEKSELDESNLISMDVEGKRKSISKRAIKNLLKLTGFSSRLHRELSPELLERDLNFQLNRYSSLNLIEIDNNVEAIFDGRTSYNAYHDFLPSLDKLVFIRGMPVRDDFISFQTYEHEVGSKEDSMVLGISCEVSSTSAIRNKMGCGLFRVLCKNGMVLPRLFMTSAPVVDNVIFRGTFDAFREKTKEIKEGIEVFVRKSKDFRMGPDQVEVLMESLTVPAGMKQAILASYRMSDDGKGFLSGAYVSKIESLWDVLNVLTYLSNRMANRRSIIVTQNIVRWAEGLLSTVSLN